MFPEIWEKKGYQIEGTEKRLIFSNKGKKKNGSCQLIAISKEGGGGGKR